MLKKCLRVTLGSPPSASWHADYRHTAFIYIGGLPFNVSEGDIVTIFSQYGEPVYLNLVRDKETGKSKGFAFLKYEDQRSCDLAVDNLTGADVLGRSLRVDHCEYKLKDDEKIYDNTGGSIDEDEREEQSEEDTRPVLPEEQELLKLLREHNDDDPMKKYIVKEKEEEVEKAIARWKKHEQRHKSRSRHRVHHHRSRHEKRIRGASEDRYMDHKHRHYR